MNLSNNVNNQLTFLDLLNIASFALGLENLNANLTQNDKADLQKDLAHKTSDVIHEIHNHLERQDNKIDEINKKLDKILMKLEDLNK